MSFEFTQPFNGQQPEMPNYEQAHVTEVLSNFIDNVLLNHIDNVKTFENGKKSLIVHGEDNGQKLTIAFETIPDELDFKKAVNLLEVDKKGSGGDYISYRLGMDGIVRRVDIPKRSPEEEQLYILESQRISEAGLSLDSLRAGAEKALEGLANFRLETNMGVNNQPVGLGEIENMMNLVVRSISHNE